MGTPHDNFRLRVAPVYDGGDSPRVRFVAHVAAAGFVHLAHDEFRGAVDAAAAAALGRAELVRAKSGGTELEAFVWLAGGLACMIDGNYGTITVKVASNDPDAVAAAVADLRTRLHRPEPPPSTVPFAFWSAKPGGGGAVRHRDVDVTAWSEARANYSAGVARALGALMDVREPRRARLLVWRGQPGTGQDVALRALAGAWRDWCSAHYVIDPRALLGTDPALPPRRPRVEGRGRRAAVAAARARRGRDDRARHQPQRRARRAAERDRRDPRPGQRHARARHDEQAGRAPPPRRAASRGRCLADVEFGPLSRAEFGGLAPPRRQRERAAAPAHARRAVRARRGRRRRRRSAPGAASFGFSRALER